MPAKLSAKCCICADSCWYKQCPDTHTSRNSSTIHFELLLDQIVLVPNARIMISAILPRLCHFDATNDIIRSINNDLERNSIRLHPDLWALPDGRETSWRDVPRPRWRPHISAHSILYKAVQRQLLSNISETAIH